MANAEQRLSQNVPGKYYVDKECIGCTECVRLAAAIFDIDEEADLAFVKKQPSSEEEKKQAAQALDVCPVQAIGDDG